MGTDHNGQRPQIPGFPACLGLAENYAGRVPVYSGLALSRLVRKGRLDPWLVENSHVLQFFPCAYDTFRKLGFPAWQGLDYAVAGIGRWHNNSMLVYNKKAVLHLLDASVVDVPEGQGELLVRVLVNNIYREQVLPVCLGRRTPFFMTDGE